MSSGLWKTGWLIKESKSSCWIDVPKEILFQRQKSLTFAHGSYWPLNVGVSQTSVTDFFLSFFFSFVLCILSLVISFILKFSNAIYVLMVYKFISLCYMSFLNSRTLYLTLTSVPPFGCMAETSNFMRTKQVMIILYHPPTPHFL